jgi:long-chain acyl-CoA synthetase
MILYTSGTTGAPRGAAITHASLLAHTAALVEHALGLGPDDRVMGVLPLTHSYGIRMVVLATLHAGASAVLVPRFDAVSTLRLLTAECVTWLPVVPTMLAALAAARWTLGPGPNVHLAGRNSEAARFPALRWCLSAGAPLAEDVRVRAEARLGVEVRQGYGLTEATFCTIDAPPVPRTPGSVGRPVPGIEVRIAGADGRDAMPGDTGEVRVRGDNVMRGYVGDDDATQHVIRDGWLHTGDIGRLDVHGALFVVDRTKDLIIRGGNNVYPSEVEDVLARHPDVAEAAVVGRPDAYYGEEIVAVVVLRDGATLDPAALDAHAREHLSPVKVPRELAVVDALPLGPSRKVLKRELREMLAAGKLEVRRVR